MFDFVKNNLLNPFQLSHLLESPKLPIGCLYSDSIILNKDETISCVMSLQGIDYKSLSQARQKTLYDLRKSTFAQNDNLVISIYHARFRKENEIKPSQFDDVHIQKIYQTWIKSFKFVFETKHYLMLTTKTNPIKKFRDIKHDVEKLERVSTYFMSALEEFQPKLLKSESLIQFLATLINAKNFENPLHVLKDKFFDEWLINTPIQMSRFDPFLHYLDHDQVSSFLTIKNYGDYAAQPVFERLIELPINMIVSHHFDFIEKQTSMKYVEDKIRFTKSFVKHADYVLSEYLSLQDQLQADLLQLIEHAFTIQVISSSEEKNKAECLIIKKLLDQNGYLVRNEKLLKEGLYYSQFAPSRKNNKRKRNTTTENAGCFVSFPTSQKGITTCSWGNEPLAQFSTLSGAIYNFCFHKDNSQSALGHTLVVGASGSGKTTLISFLLSQALKYKNMKMLAFDQLQGMEVATTLLGGHYINFQKGGLSLNPFDLDTDDASFLADFICDMAKANDDEEKIRIIEGSRQILNWKLANRTIDNLLNGISQKGEPLFERLKRYSSLGDRGGLFAQDSIDLSSQWLCFDFTEILGSPDELGLFSSFLSHKFFKSCDGTPRLIFVDEFRRYLESDIFSKICVRLLQELRKLNGVFVAAVQNLNDVYDHPVGKKNLSNFAKFILFPAKEGLQEEAYIKGVGLTFEEFQWLKNTDPKSRLVMIKTSDSTNIVQINLAFLHQYLQVFNSSQENVRTLRNLMAQGISKQTLLQHYLQAL